MFLKTFQMSAMSANHSEGLCIKESPMRTFCGYLRTIEKNVRKMIYQMSAMSARISANNSSDFQIVRCRCGHCGRF